MNYTIYIRKENWDYFKDEENKSELVNSLLESHYGKGQKPAEEREEVHTNETPPEVPKVAQKALKTCKNGHQTFRDDKKCMVKDCKYNIY